MPHRINRERFFSKLKLDPNTGCMEWCGETYERGYGKMYSTAGKFRAHRVAAYLAGMIDTPRGSQSGLDDNNVLHTCDNPKCCNPEHLFVGTHADNVADMLAKGRGRGVSVKPTFVGPPRPEGYAKKQRRSRRTQLPKKYSDDQIEEIRLLVGAGIYSQCEMARKLGRSQGWISLVVNGKVRKA